MQAVGLPVWLRKEAQRAKKTNFISHIHLSIKTRSIVPLASTTQSEPWEWATDAPRCLSCSWVWNRCYYMQQLLYLARHSSLGKCCPPKTLLAWHEPRLQVWLTVKYSGISKKGSVKLGVNKLALKEKMKDFVKCTVKPYEFKLKNVGSLFVRTE